MTVTPCNMHTDLVIANGLNGALSLTARDSKGASLSVTLSAGIAARVGRAAGLGGAPALAPHAPAGVDPFNMHTDAQTRVTPNAAGTRITVVGPATAPDRSTVTLKLTIEGAALTALKKVGS